MTVIAMRTATCVIAALLAGSALGQAPPQIPGFPGAGIANPQPKFATAVSVDRADGIYRDRETLRVQFGSHVESFLYLLYHTVDGQTNLMFPNGIQSDNRTPASQPVVVPPENGPYVFRVAPPLGKEVLQVIASRSPLVELDRLVQKEARAAIVPADVLKSLQTHLLKEPDTWAEHRIPIETISGDEPAPPTQAARRVGLFIGIGKYQNSQIAPPHEELRNSAVALHELMLHHGGLQEDHARLLLDEQATRAAMHEAITGWLPSVSRPGDTVFIYFSGHAAKLEDGGDPTEPDGRDETIGPYDIDAGPENLPRAERLRRYRDSNITDDVLARWLQELHGRQIVLILDTCWSGGVVESKGLSQMLDNELARTKDIAQPNTLVLTSCASDEQSLFEGTRNKTMWFTYCLTEAIQKKAKDKPLTVQAAYEYARKRMKELLREGNAGREQQPQMIDNVLLPIVLVP